MALWLAGRPTAWPAALAISAALYGVVPRWPSSPPSRWASAGARRPAGPIPVARAAGRGRAHRAAGPPAAGDDGPGHGRAGPLRVAGPTGALVAPTLGEALAGGLRGTLAPRPEGGHNGCRAAVAPLAGARRAGGVGAPPAPRRARRPGAAVPPQPGRPVPGAPLPVDARPAAAGPAALPDRLALAWVPLLCAVGGVGAMLWVRHWLSQAVVALGRCPSPSERPGSTGPRGRSTRAPWCQRRARAPPPVEEPLAARAFVEGRPRTNLHAVRSNLLSGLPGRHGGRRASGRAVSPYPLRGGVTLVAWSPGRIDLESASPAPPPGGARPGWRATDPGGGRSCSPRRTTGRWWCTRTGRVGSGCATRRRGCGPPWAAPSGGSSCSCGGGAAPPASREDRAPRPLLPCDAGRPAGTRGGLEAADDRWCRTDAVRAVMDRRAVLAGSWRRAAGPPGALPLRPRGRGPRHPRAGRPGAPHFFSVCCALVRWPGGAVLIDPFFTHVPLLRVAFGRTLPDPAALSDPAGRFGDVRAVLVGHSHYDHAMGLPWWTWLADDAQVLGTHTLAHTFAASGLRHPIVGLDGHLASPTDAGTWWRHPAGRCACCPSAQGTRPSGPSSISSGATSTGTGVARPPAPRTTRAPPSPSWWTSWMGIGSTRGVRPDVDRGFPDGFRPRRCWASGRWTSRW